jgi:hypothetical protein
VPSSRMPLSMITIAVMLSVALPATAGAAVHPEMQCVTYNAVTGTAQVRLAGVNTGPSGIVINDIAAGDDNFFSPAPMDREQPNQFIPGFTPWDYSVHADRGDITWSVQGNALTFSTASAELPFERPCAYRGPEISGVEPATLTLGGGAQSVTIFGVGLGTGATVAIDGVPTAASPSAATANRLDVPVTIGAGVAAGAHDLLVTDANGNQTGCRGCVRVAAPAASPLPGPQGPQGPHGPQGPLGQTGPAGAAGTVGRPRTVRARAKTVRAGRVVSSRVTCPAGTNVLSGGYDLAPARGGAAPLVTRNRPVATGWRVTVREARRSRAHRLTAYAVCA